MIIRNELERRRAEQQAEYLRSELEKIPATEQQDEVTQGVISGLHMQISDLEDALAEYKRLKEGLESVLKAESFDDIGKLLIKARIARDWSQADLAKILDMEPQQVQRYERNDWQKISLWRLQEVVEALGLDVTIHARLHGHEDQDIEPPQIMPAYRGWYPGVVGNVSLGIVETLGDFGVSFGEALGNVSVGISEVLGNVTVGITEALSNVSTGISEVLGGIQPMTIRDAMYPPSQKAVGTVYRVSQPAPNAPQTMPEIDWSAVGAPVIIGSTPTVIIWQQSQNKQLKETYA